MRAASVGFDRSAFVRRATRAGDEAPAASAARLCAVAVFLLPLMTPIAASANLSIVDLGIAAAVAGCLWWATSSRARLAAPYALPVGLTAVAGTLAAMRGAYPLVGGLAVIQDLFLLAWAIAIANLARTREALSILTKAWCYSAVFWAAALVVAAAAGDTAVSGASHATGGRAAFTFGNENTASAYYAISLLLILACRRPRNPIARVAAAGTIVLAVVLTGSLAGIFGLFGAVLMILLALVWRRSGVAPAVVVLAVATMAVGTSVWLYHHSDIAQQATASRYAVVRFTLGRTSWSAGEREALARETASIYRSGDLIGIGPASTKLTLYALQAPYVREAHNDWAAALLERGVFGAIGVMALFAVIGFYTITVGMRALREPYAEVVPAPWFLLGTLPILLVFSFTHEALHDRTVWTLLGLIAALHLWCRVAPVAAPIASGRDG
jgi:hypothetical protein